MKKLLPLMLLMFLCVNIHGQTLHGARAQGMGGAFSAVSDDASALSWNPAGLSLFQRNTFISHYTGLYYNFCPDNLGTGSLGYVHHIPDFVSVGVTGNILYSDIYSRNTIGLNVSRKFSKNFTLGVRGNIFLTGYNENNFFYADEDNPDDPLFDNNNYNSNSFGLDIGAIGKPTQNISLGLYVRNAISPNLSLTSGGESKSPWKTRLGAAYTFHDKYTISGDLAYSSKSLSGSSINYFAGFETWQFDRKIGLRTGINPDQFSFGLSYRNPAFALLGINYSFIYPLSKVGLENATSHKISLSMGYKPKKEAEPEPQPEPEPVTMDTTPKVPPKPKANISITPSKLRVEEVTQIYEEAPLVPVVFFDSNSGAVDHRFDSLLKTIGHRVADNPGVEIKLYGYYDSNSEEREGNLALERARAVKKRMTDLVPESERDISVVSSGYSKSESRAGLKRKAPSDEDQKMINQENRRVEFRTEIRGYSKELTLEGSSVEDVAREYKSLLSKNEEVDLIIEGGTEERLGSAFDFKEKLLEILPENFSDRIFVSLSGKGKRYIKLAADGIIYRPKRVRNAVEVSNIGQAASIKIDAEIPGGIESYSIEISKSDGKTFEEIASGEEELPEKIEWNWRDSEGNLLDIRGDYIAKVSVKDTFGREISVSSTDTMGVKITERKKIRSKLLIVQFVYNEDVAQAVFLEDRLEYVTRKLLDYAREPHKQLNVEIAGHTDVLGTHSRNMELSRERAETEYENIKVYLRNILNLPDEEALKDWLSERNIEITHKGYGPNKPYTINRWEEGDKKKLKLGDNSLPEGRTINRRVIIDMELIKE